MHAEWVAAVVVSTSFVVLAVIALSLVALALLGGLFAPTLKYGISSHGARPNDSEEFLSYVEALTDAKANRHSIFEVLTNGGCFYQTQLAAIRAARNSVNIEAYIFHRGDIGDQYLAALVERARAGVRVNLVLDAFGSHSVNKKYFAALTQAGGKVAWYNRARWYNLFHVDNRTHRELMIVDGRVGFIGGAGIADQWFKSMGSSAQWRDTMVKVEGDAVPCLQATFAENWLQASGELITGIDYFPENEYVSEGAALVVNSTPTIGGSTRARMLFQLLIASASKTIHITTPYFLPDKSLTEELLKAIKKRHVEIKILVPGKKSDHMLTRSASRRGYGRLLQAGAEVFEYQAAMIHAKILLVDGLWCVVGSTNFDQRSFGINDEVNMAVREKELALRLEKDFILDIASSRQMSYEEWRNRPILERAPEILGAVLEHQQ